MKSLKQSLKQMPLTVAVMIIVASMLLFKMTDKTLVDRVEIYFAMSLCFTGWCFKQLREPTITDEEAERLGKRWEQEVRNATQKLADVVKNSLDLPGYDNRLYGLRNKASKEWTKEQDDRLHEIYHTSLWRLQDLAWEFRKDEHKKQLRRWWEHAEKQDVDIPGFSKLLATGLRHVPPLETVNGLPLQEKPLTPEEKEVNRMGLLKEFLPEKYEEELRKKKG